MLAGFTYTGRSPSSGSVNRAVGLKFRSTVPPWFMLYENVPVAFIMKRLSRTARCQLSVDRRLFCVAYSGSIIATLGATFENTVPVVPFAHAVGIVDASAA